MIEEIEEIEEIENIMEKLDDGIHHCNGCGIYPCTSQEVVIRKDICGECPVPCCYMILAALVPCEDNKYKNHDVGSLKMGKDGWCQYFNKDIGCTIYEIRPITCRVASCRFIREGKMPEELKILKKERKRKEEEKRTGKMEEG